MLSLQLKSGEYLTIGDDIVVQVFEQGGTIRVAVKAPRELPILRGEVHERDGQRPDGLLRQRPKTPSERVRNARRMEELAAAYQSAGEQGSRRRLTLDFSRPARTAGNRSRVKRPTQSGRMVGRETHHISDGAQGCARIMIRR